MKKALIYIAAFTLTVISCKRDEQVPGMETIKEVESIATQNSNDDAAIAKYLEDHYLDAQGNIKAFSTSSTADDNMPKLSSLNPQKLASGVIVIKREGAQPDPGTTIGTTDIIHLMTKTVGYLSNEEKGVISFVSEAPLLNTVETTGVPEVDPQFYYVKQSTLDASKKPRSYYEIEGFQEGLKHFKAFNKEKSEPYNMQGIIIVPSRAAFARDEHNAYGMIGWRNRSFVFNFQVYKSIPR